MSKNQRDTQFAGFADLLLTELRPDLAFLFTELRSKRGVTSAENIIKWHIAQRAHDLVSHALEHFCSEANIELDEPYTGTPDLTAWPEEGKG